MRIFAFTLLLLVHHVVLILFLCHSAVFLCLAGFLPDTDVPLLVMLPPTSFLRITPGQRIVCLLSFCFHAAECEQEFICCPVKSAALHTLWLANCRSPLV